jgi:hypothetical protein
MPPASPFTIAADIFDPPVNPYLNDPAGWVHDRLNGWLWSKQREIAEALVAHRNVVVPSCHSAGKSFTCGRIAAWWIDIHPPGEALVVTTAPTWAQVRAVLWQEIGRAHRGGDLPGRVTQSEWLIGNELVGLGRKPADTNKAAFQGLHRKYVLVIIDEADGVAAGIWEVVRSLASNEHARILAVGNPVDSTSEFARLCRDGSGWHRIRINAFDTPNFTGEPVPPEIAENLLSPIFEEEARRDYGIDSPYYVSRILAQHPIDSTDVVIPMSWVQAAVERWSEADADGTLAQLHRTCVGVDVARGGADKTVIAVRCKNAITELHRSNEDSTVVTTAFVAPWISLPGVWATIDVLNMGAGPVDQLRALDLAVVAFNAGESTPMLDRAGVLGFVNKRSAAWWNLREMLHPQSGADVMLPPDEKLIGDLTTPKWRATPGGKIAVEKKDDIKKRLGRSTDDGDAVVQAFWPEAAFTTASMITDDPRSKSLTGDLLNMQF